MSERPRLDPAALRSTLSRARSGVQPHRAANVAHGIRRVASVLHALAGTDEQESRVIEDLKSDLGDLEGETVQDVTLFLAYLADGIAEDVADGKVTAGEVTSTLFAQMEHLLGVVEDVQGLKD